MSLSLKPEITRVDLSKQGDRVMIETWSGDQWSYDDPAQQIYPVETSIVSAMIELEDLGFACHMESIYKGRAIRGKITRIDFAEIRGEWQVKKFPRNWTADTPPAKTENKGADFDIQSAIEWCKANGYVVFEWPGGARAWLGEPMPVRDKKNILKLRRKVESHTTLTSIDERHKYDLAYCF